MLAADGSDNRTQAPKTSEGQKEHAALPLEVQAALRDKRKIFDGGTHRCAGSNGDDTGHRIPVRDTHERQADQRGHIVRQQDSLLPSGPCQNSRVVGSGQTDILDANKVEVGETAAKAADDAGVEVLVRGQSEQRVERLPSPREQAFADSGRGESPFDVLAHAPSRRIALDAIRIHVGLVPKVVGDD